MLERAYGGAGAAAADAGRPDGARASRAREGNEYEQRCSLTESAPRLIQQKENRRPNPKLGRIRSAALGSVSRARETQKEKERAPMRADRVH
jgi:hypothetical protein